MTHHRAIFKFKTKVIEIMIIALIVAFCTAGMMQNVTPVYIGGF